MNQAANPSIKRSSNVWPPMELVLHPHKAKTLLVAAVYALLGVLCLYVNSLVLHRDAGSGGVLFAVLLGAMSLFYALRLHPSVTYFKLTHRGFEYKNYLPARFIECKHVHHFTTHVVKSRRYVGWRYAESFYNRGTESRFGKILLVIRNRFRSIFSGIEDGLWVNFGHQPETLARLLEDWRQQHSEAS